jgi:hypothetical protein
MIARGSRLPAPGQRCLRKPVDAGCVRA